MDAKICNRCKVRLDDGGEYYTFQMVHMEMEGKIAETEQVRDLCVGCELLLRPAIDFVDAGIQPQKMKRKKKS